VPELKRIIESMIAALPQLSTVFGLCAACYMLFGILGMQLFGGHMSQRCRDDATGDFDFDSGRFCSVTSSGRQCPDGSTCASSDVSLNDGITNFDNIFLAFLAVFQSCTLEGWVDMMYALMDTMPSWVPGLYFVILIWIGSLFLLNLVGSFQDKDCLYLLTNFVQGGELLSILPEEGLEPEYALFYFANVFLALSHLHKVILVVLILYSYCTRTVLILYSYCTHTLYSYCTRTVLIHCTHTLYSYTVLTIHFLALSDSTVSFTGISNPRTA